MWYTYLLQRTKSKQFRFQKGQSLIEILIGLVIGVIIIGAVVGLLIISLRSDSDTKNTQTASFLAQDNIDKIKSISESNWNKIYNLSKGSSSTYYLLYDASSSAFYVLSGYETLTFEGKVFRRYFYVEDVNRNQCGVGSISTSSITPSCAVGYSWPPPVSRIDLDPSTLKITAVVLWNNDQRSVKISQYITRSQNQIFQQTDWSGGPGQENFPVSNSSTVVNNKFATSSMPTSSDPSLRGVDYSTPGVIKIQGF